MPELPEVETIVRGLRHKIVGKKFATITVLDHRILINLSAQKFKKQLFGRRILGVDRRAKYIIIRLDNNKYLLVHLGMTGGLVFRQKADAAVKYTKWFAVFSNGNYLYYIDARLFGETRLVDQKTLSELNQKLGPEPLNAEFKFGQFWEGLQRRKTNIKSLLLNQKFLSGVGNIYACEALFLAKVSPLRCADSLKKGEAERLFMSIKKVLRQGIKYRGTTVDSYVDAEGKAGGFQKKLKVYARGGKKCFRCKGTIRRIVVGQRGTYYCPQCQK